MVRGTRVLLHDHHHLRQITERIIGTGIDILDRRRMARMVAGDTACASAPDAQRLARLSRRILSGAELDCPEFKLAASSSDLWSADMVGFLANRWTAKEAAYKALYPYHEARWKELSLLKGQPGQPKKPVLIFHPHSHITLHVSLSHDGPYTIASVLATSSSSPDSPGHHTITTGRTHSVVL
ncbi:hypothetical protein PtB15_5B150 [Puccinia triticina]|nr:hypothetical protein PtB15_5B150 [Puccinia triticina]